MKSGFITLFVIPGLLLSQSAAVGHSHESNAPFDHGHCPHLHANSLFATTGEEFDDHDHDHEQHHDDDVVYLADGCALMESGFTASYQSVLLGWLSLPNNAHESLDGLHAPLELWPQPPPRQVAPVCPIYLQIQSLLI